MRDERVLVCGGRDFADTALAFATLYDIQAERGISVIIHGGARGADSIAGRWARTAGVPCEVYPADWQRDGRAAGPIRNARMLVESNPTLVVAFPGGRGTADMVAKAKRAGVPVVEVQDTARGGEGVRDAD